jgi:transcriptional regulator with XRE-family HTH domain
MRKLINRIQAIRNPQTVGDMLYCARMEAGLTQRALAERLGHHDPVCVRFWELNKTEPRVSTLIRIAKALGLNLLDLIPPHMLEANGAKMAEQLAEV